VPAAGEACVGWFPEHLPCPARKLMPSWLQWVSGQALKSQAKGGVTGAITVRSGKKDMGNPSFLGRRPFMRFGCAGVIAIPVIICSITVVTARVKQQHACPQGVDVPTVHLSGEYVVQDVQGFNNRSGFTGMPLDQVEHSSVVTVLQDSHSLQFIYTDWKGRERIDKIMRIGRKGSRWVWSTNGLAGSGLPVRILNLYMLPGLFYYDQRGTLTQTTTGLTLDYTWAQGGALFWIMPWNDEPSRTRVSLIVRGADPKTDK